MTDRTSRITLAALLLLLLIMGFAAWKLWALSDGVNVKFAALDKGIQTIIELQEKIAMSVTTTVTDTQGDPHAVTTTRKDNEEMSDYVQRHKDHIAAYEAL